MNARSPDDLITPPGPVRRTFLTHDPDVELERYRALTEAALDVTSILAEDGTILYESPAVLGVAGWHPEELVGRNAFALIHPDDRERAFEAFAAVLRGEGKAPVEYRWQGRDGRWVWIESSAVDCRHVPSVRGLVIHSRDVTERHETRSKLDRLARYDELTGALNRASLRLELPGAVARAAAAGRTGAVLFIDLDRFKFVNDSLGHATGDRVLREIARRLTDGLRAGDAVFRVGGDEFVVVVEDALSRDDVASVARNVCDTLARPIDIDGMDLVTGASVGIALFGDEAGEPAELLRRADTAMYRTKEEGRGGFRFYTPAMEAGLRRRLDTERALRQALRDEAFALVYQPIVDLRSGAVRWVEALLRWPGDDGSVRAPESFIAVAEETRLIVPLGTWVLRRACGAAKRWRAAGIDARVAVNLAPAQLADEAFLDVVRGVLAAEDLPGRALAFDLTETALAAAEPATLATLAALRELGAELSLDDFGAGTSSLSALRRLSVDAFKVDHSFVAGIGRDGRDEALVRAIVAIGHETGTLVVAEGVETAEQAAFLRDLRCDAAQGRYVAPEIDEDAIHAWLAAHAPR